MKRTKISKTNTKKPTGRASKNSKKTVRQQITEGVKKAASKAKEKLKIVYNRSTRQWERPKYMRQAEFERQLAEKEAVYTRRRAREVEHLFQRANERVSQLIASGLESEALRNLEKAGRDTYYFDPRGKNKEELLAEIQMVKDFMQNPTSTIQGAEQFTRELLGNEWKEVRGGSYQEQYEEQARKVQEEGGFEKFNERIVKISNQFYIVNNEQAKLAFAAYREAMSGGLAAEGMYDSENLITYAFSYIEQQGLADKDQDNMGNVISALRQYVDDKKLLRSKEWESAFKNAGAVSDIIADEGAEALDALRIR